MDVSAKGGDGGGASATALIVGAAITELIDDIRSVPTTLDVLGHFSSGIYLRGPSGPFALSDNSIPAGPLHLIVSRPIVGATSATEVVLSADRLTVGDLLIELDGAAPWDPVLPSPTLTPRIFRRLLAELVDYRPPPAELKAVWPRVRQALAAGDYEAMTTLLEGRGSGLTPIGDDVLAGWMMADALRYPVPHRDLRNDLAHSIRSTDLSRVFLRFAARGQSIEPLHRLFSEAAADEQANLRATAADLATIGESSGRAMLAGIMLAVDEWRDQLPR